jgi:coenzyme F420-0:L-glutamate ligase/coenzyme F420-1:gamma-L-glutamate ligase
MSPRAARVRRQARYSASLWTGRPAGTHVLDSDQLRLIDTTRSATLATLSPSGQPRLVPVCFVLAEPARGEAGTSLYSPLDEKPKRSGDVRELARVRDIAERPAVTLLFERWSEDWSQLAWLRARGMAALVEPQGSDASHRWAVDALRLKYPQYRSQGIESLPMIRISISEVIGWSAAAVRTRKSLGGAPPG